MQPSSRTPEGEPNKCPICENANNIEPSGTHGDAPCPCCGHLLWFHLEDGVLEAVYSTGEAARLCKVSQQTIVRLFDSGELRGYIATGATGSRKRRIPHSNLLACMQKYGVPVGG